MQFHSNSVAVNKKSTAKLLSWLWQTCNSYMFVKNNTRNRSSSPEVLRKNVVLKSFAKFTGKNSYICVSFLEKLHIKKPLGQVFSTEFCEVFKNSFLYKTHPVVASGKSSYFKIWSTNDSYKTQYELNSFIKIMSNHLPDM